MIKLTFRNLSLPVRLLETHSGVILQNFQRNQNAEAVQKYFHSSSNNCEKNHGSGMRGASFWEPDKRGGYAEEDEITWWQHAKRGAKLLPNETKKLYDEVKYHFSPEIPKEGCPQDNVIDKFFEFGSLESLNNWSASSDQDYDAGFSTANVSLTERGTGLFTGNLSTRTPKSGQIENSGYVNLRYIPPMRSFARENYYFFGGYTHLALRVRGDGRNYMINVHPHSFCDLDWFDLYSYVLHTRGGPYWQETKIPFSKLFLHHKGRVQDSQFPVDSTDVKGISLSLIDQNDGPFSLEIDYVGCLRDPMHKEVFHYESYRCDKYLPRN